LEFLENDTAGMAKLLENAAVSEGLNATLLSMDADTATYAGALRKAREISLRIDSNRETANGDSAATLRI